MRAKPINYSFQAQNWNTALPFSTTSSKVLRVALKSLSFEKRKMEETRPLSNVKPHSTENAADTVGNTPLHIAVSDGEEAVVALLHKRGGVEFLRPNREGKTPVFLAAEQGKGRVVKTLIDWHEEQGYPLTKMQKHSLDAILQQSNL